jgi:hypothetical protein
MAIVVPRESFDNAPDFVVYSFICPFHGDIYRMQPDEVRTCCGDCDHDQAS